MHLVTHRQTSRDDVLERDAAAVRERGSERRCERAGDPAQPVEHLAIVAAEAHDPAQAFVDRAVRTIPERAVLDDQHRLARRRHARHRPHGAEMVVGMEREATRGRGLRGVVERLRPALEHGGAAYRATHRSAHPVPFDGWTGMQDRVPAEALDHFAGRTHADEHRLCGEDPAHRLLVRELDFLQFALPILSGNRIRYDPIFDDSRPRWPRAVNMA